VQNVVPVASPIETELADRAVEGRRDQYAAEVRRLIDAAFAVMARTGDIDPPVREIVQTAGLSNQAFYRHFASKDALLLAALADGQRQLVEYLSRRVASAANPAEQLRAWVEGVMAQARNLDAADATRPFALNGPRLADRYAREIASSRAELVATLAPVAEALGGSAHAAQFVCDLALARMNEAIAHRRRPSRSEVQDLVAFCHAGVSGN
jgi:AcrR family transcriptional regulator